jgi:monothiol glutaredoxin
MRSQSLARSVLRSVRQPRNHVISRSGKQMLFQQEGTLGRRMILANASIGSTRLFSSSGKVGEGSHADFQKQTKSNGNDANENTEIFDVQQWLGKVVKEHPVLLFMKGSPQSPKCGFSASVVHILNDIGCEFASADILENEDVRSGLKVFSNWPTFPQLYIGGEFIGGADIVAELQKTGGLKPMLEKVGAVKKQ